MITLHDGDCLEIMRGMESGIVQTCITSPPYLCLRDYGIAGQIGTENTPEEYVEKLVEVFREVRRLLRDDGTLWIVIGDSFASRGGPEPAQSKWRVDGASNTQNQGKSRNPGKLKEKDLIGIPWMLAFALRSDGWFLRSEIIWEKPNQMPESVKDRPTRSHETIFLLSRSRKYFYDADAIREPRSSESLRESGRNRRSVWTVTTKGFRGGAHFATYPPALIGPCVLAGSAKGDTVLDPFSGAATTGLVAAQHGRHYIGIDLNPEYNEIARKRLGLDKIATMP